ncbi:MAG: carbohydrate ABC transporter permease [Cellulomonadaceae bacterium]
MSSSQFPFARRAPMRVSFGLGVGLLTIFGLVPAVGVAVVAFTDIRGLPGIPVHWVGLENFRSFFSPAHLGDNANALRNTLEFAFFSTIFQISLGLMIAVLLNQRLRGRNLYRSIVFMPTVLGVTVTGLIWTLVLNPAGGPAASLLEMFGTSSAFFGDPNLALKLIIFVQVWATLGIAVVIFLAGLQSIPDELYECSAIDGARRSQQFWHVTMPMLAPSMTANVLLGIVNSLQSYQLAYVLTGPINRSTQLLSLLIYTQAFGGVPGASVSQTQGYAAAISMVQFVLVGAIALATLAYLRRREARL